MIVTVHKSHVVLSLVYTVLFLGLFPAFALSQENTDIKVNTTPSEVIETTVSNPVPYKTESLIGNKVFDDFVLGPGKIEYEFKPGDTKTVELNVTNRYAERKKFTIEIEDIGGSSNLDKPVTLLGDDTGPYTLKDYISIPQMEFYVEPNTRALIPVTISIPPDAEPGGMYGSVLVKTVTSEAVDGDGGTTVPQSAIVSRIGTLFFITIPGDVDTAGKLQDFSVRNNKKWFEKGPINFQIVYENTGSIYLNPYGELRITNMFNEEVGYEELQPWFTLPQSLRLREISWNRELLYGRYTATLSLNRGYDNIIDEQELVFWVIPWKLGLVIFAGFFIFFWILRYFFKSFEFRRKGN